MNYNDPYGDNILTVNLGPIPSSKDLLTRLTAIPPTPQNIAQIPRHIRLHHLCNLRDIHIPSTEGQHVAETIDLMLRQGYKYRNPKAPETWRLISNENLGYSAPPTPALASIDVGHSGTGKTQTILRSLGQYPQIIRHNSFPGFVGGHIQVTWLSVEIPASGKSLDLAINLCRAWDDMIGEYYPDMPKRFEKALSVSKPNAQKLFGEWLQTAKSHWLGLMHFDEVQNLFRLPSLKNRLSRGRGDFPELSIIEDQTLKWVLEITNTWKIPLMNSGTPDGVGALMRRLSNTQRFVASGYHEHKPFQNSDDPAFTEIFLPVLLKQQWLSKPLDNSNELRTKIHKYTAGIPRLIIALWFSAQRIALGRLKTDTLLLSDLDKAAHGPMKPVMPAVKALNSGDPTQMARFEDLVRLDDGFWESFWRPS